MNKLLFTLLSSNIKFKLGGTIYVTRKPNITEQKKSLLKPKNDVVFHALFSRGKERITKPFLEDILKIKIDKLELDKSTKLSNDNVKDKNGRLDLRAVINGNVECNIEVQLVSPKFYHKKIKNILKNVLTFSKIKCRIKNEQRFTKQMNELGYII